MRLRTIGRWTKTVRWVEFICNSLSSRGCSARGCENCAQNRDNVSKQIVLCYYGLRIQFPIPFCSYKHSVIPMCSSLIRPHSCPFSRMSFILKPQGVLVPFFLALSFQLTIFCKSWMLEIAVIQQCVSGAVSMLGVSSTRAFPCLRWAHEPTLLKIILFAQAARERRPGIQMRSLNEFKRQCWIIRCPTPNQF